MPATRPEVAVRGLARLARRATTGAVPPEAHLQGRERLLAAIDAPPPRVARLPRLVLAVAAAMALIVTLILVRRPEPALSYTIDGAPPGQGYIQGGASARFSEGTRVTLAPGARGRIVDVGPRGARVSLEEGSARFDVTHREGASWLAEAGPFTVSVTGTAFDLGWSGTRVEIVMHAGSVVVRGPPAPEGIVLREGQRLVADAARAEVSRLDGSGEPASPNPSPRGVSGGLPPTVDGTGETASPNPSPRGVSGGLPPTVDDPAPSDSAGSRAANRSARTEPPAPEAPSTVGASRAPSTSARAAASWPSRVAAGDFAGVIAEAEVRGLDAALDETSLADLSALADAARYAGRGDLARRALVAERTRFPGSAEARSAAFLLGRLSDDRAPATAVTWYDRYLAEAPGGSLAAEALGRKMLALRASAGREAARPAAEEYRRRYPDGPFARAAGEILGDP